MCLSYYCVKIRLAEIRTLKNAFLLKRCILCSWYRILLSFYTPCILEFVGAQPLQKTSIAIISGTGKATNFNFFTHICRLNRNKSPLQISRKVVVGVVRDSRKFSGHTYVGRIARSSLRQLSFLVYTLYTWICLFFISSYRSLTAFHSFILLFVRSVTFEIESGSQWNGISNAFVARRN